MTDTLIGNAHHEKLVSQDKEIERANKRLRVAHTTLAAANDRLSALSNEVSSDRYQSASESVARASVAYNKAVSSSKAQKGKGSGHVGLLLPNAGAPDFM